MKATLYANSIRCGGCAANVRAVLGKTPGVRAVEVDPSAKRVDVDFDDVATSLDTLSRTLADAGYPVGAPRNSP